MHVLLRVFHLSVHVTNSHVGLTCAFKACIISAVRLQSWRANNDTKSAVPHKDRRREKGCSQAPSKVYLKWVSFSQFYSPYRHKNWCHGIQSPILNQGQGSPSACPLMGTHLGSQTVRRFVYLFFPPFLHLQSQLSWQATTENKGVLSIIGPSDVSQSRKENSHWPRSWSANMKASTWKYYVNGRSQSLVYVIWGV